MEEQEVKIKITADTSEFQQKLEKLQEITKAGRVLSSSNEADLNKANDMLDQAGELIEGVLEQVTGKPVPEPADTGSDVKPSAPATPAAPGTTPPKAPKMVVGYPLGQNIVEVTVDEHKEAETKAEDVIPIVDDGSKPEPEKYLIDEDTLKEVLEHFGLEAQGEGETLDTEEE